MSDRDPVQITAAFASGIGLGFVSLLGQSLFAWMLMPIVGVCIFQLLFEKNSDVQP